MAGRVPIRIRDPYVEENDRTFVLDASGSELRPVTSPDAEARATVSITQLSRMYVGTFPFEFAPELEGCELTTETSEFFGELFDRVETAVPEFF